MRINAIASILSYAANRLRVLLKNNNEEEPIVSREKVTAFKKWLDQ